MDAAAPRSGQWPRWRLATIVFGVAAAALLVMFWPTAASMEQIWRTNDSYQHTYLVPVILAWLVWEDRDRLAQLTPRADWRGAAYVRAASLGWLLGWAAQVQVVQQVALIGMLQGLVLAVFGWRVVRLLWFPLLFMVFLAPMGDFMVPILQRWTADVVVWSVNLTGIPTTTDGFMITLNAGAESWERFHVARESSGIRYLTAMFQIGLLTAWLLYRSRPRRLAAVLAALVVPILANWARAVGIVLIVYHTEGRRGGDVDHLIYGFWFFLLVLAIYIGVCWLFAEAAPKRPHAHFSDETAAPREARRMLGVVVAAVIAAAPAPLWAILIQYPIGTEPIYDEVFLPAEAGGWRRTDYQGLDWRPVYQGADKEVLARYVKGAHAADLYVAAYNSQREGAELIGWGNDLAGAGWESLGERLSATVTIDGEPVVVSCVRLAQPGRKRTVFYWYWVDGMVTGSDTMAKLGMTWARLRGARPDAIVAIAVDEAGDPAETRELVQDFIRILPSTYELMVGVR